MTDQPSIRGKYDRHTGQPATIYTPPEDLIDPPQTEPTPDADRVNDWAEVVQAASCDIDPDKWWLPLSVRHSIARAVIALAGSERADDKARIAELEAEVDRLRGQEKGQTKAAQSAWRAADKFREDLAKERARASAAERGLAIVTESRQRLADALADERAAFARHRDDWITPLFPPADWSAPVEIPLHESHDQGAGSDVPKEGPS